MHEARPWRGAATGVGSLPHLDPGEALCVVFGELPRFPHLPELPARGPGADMVARTVAMLPDVYVDRAPSGWRLVSRPGMDHRRAVDYLARDLDALADVAADYIGPLKLQVCGPWTLAATVELARGDRALADSGAVRDLAAALSEGALAHVVDVSNRVPGAQTFVQLDEPVLPAVLEGSVPTASGFGALRSVEEPLAEERMAGVVAVLETVSTAGVHCCAPQPPIDLMRRAGARFLSLDATLVREADDEALATCLDNGVDLFLGLVPSPRGAPTPRSSAKRGPNPAAAEIVSPRGAPTPRSALADAQDLAGPARELWHRVGRPPDELTDRVVVTPTCGLAAASTDEARGAMRQTVEVARVLAEAPAPTRSNR